MSCWLVFTITGCLAVVSQAVDVDGPLHADLPQLPRLPRATLIPKLSGHRIKLPDNWGNEDDNVPRIINGTQADYGEYPYQAYFGPIYDGYLYFSCGGVIISEKYVLTAAHCVDASQESGIVAGNERWSKADAYSVVKRVASIRMHNYIGSSDLYQNDIAILTLDGTLTFNSRIQPIKLANKKKEKRIRSRGGNCVVTGLGKRNDTDYQRPDRLRELDVTLTPQSDCKYVWQITDKQICVANVDGSSYKPAYRGVCNGDSGGPLACTYKGTPFLVGLVSFGGSSFPSGYSCSYGYNGYNRVSAYRRWIKKHTGV